MDVSPLLDELRMIAQNGLEYANDPHDGERYERILELTAEWYGRAAELHRRRSGHGLRRRSVTPPRKLGVTRRCSTTAGGFTDPNESPRETAIRDRRPVRG